MKIQSHSRANFLLVLASLACLAVHYEQYASFQHYASFHHGIPRAQGQAPQPSQAPQPYQLPQPHTECTTCAICTIDFSLPNLDENEPVRPELQCGDKFHINCLLPWIQRGHYTCPTCRATIKIYELVENVKVNGRDETRVIGLNRAATPREEAAIKVLRGHRHIEILPRPAWHGAAELPPRIDRMC